MPSLPVTPRGRAPFPAPAASMEAHDPYSSTLWSGVQAEPVEVKPVTFVGTVTPLIVAVFTVAPPAPVPAEGGAAADVLGEPAVQAGELPHATAARATPASTGRCQNPVTHYVSPLAESSRSLHDASCGCRWVTRSPRVTTTVPGLL